jgi:iron-sulfur cluster assembly protein
LATVSWYFPRATGILRAILANPLSGPETLNESDNWGEIYMLRAILDLFSRKPRREFVAGDLPPVGIRGAQSRKAVAGRRTVVKLTRSAVTELRKAQAQEGKRYLRVGVLNEGPTGYMYSMGFDDQFDVENDCIDDVDGITIIVNRFSAIYLDGVTIDWKTDSDGRQGFHFDNPNAVQ